jgi:FkbM family methyltransferase
MSLLDKLHWLYRQTSPTLGLSKYRIFSILRNILLRSPIQIGEYYMYLNPNDHVVSPHLFNHRNWETNETSLAMKIIQHGDVVYDCGANIGYFTLLYSKLVGPTGKVFAFEPDPVNFRFLERNLLLNSCKNVTLIQKAVSYESGSIDLYIDEYNRGDHRTYDAGSGLKCIKVLSTSLNDHLTEYNNPPTFIKMDIQGAEYHALLGMNQILDHKSQLSLSLEYWPHAIVQQGLKPGQFLDFIKQKGFTFNEIDEGGNLIPVEVPILLKKYDLNYGSCTTLFCTRN